MGKLSSLPSNTSPVAADQFIMVQNSGPTDVRSTLSSVMTAMFSSQLTSGSNGGTAGGTHYYINLGGIKLAWLAGGTVSNVNGQNNWTWTLPVGFFTTIQTVLATVNVPGTSASQIITVVSSNTTTVTFADTSTGISTGQIHSFVIGT